MENIGSLKSYGAGSMLIRLAFMAACSVLVSLTSGPSEPGCVGPSSSEYLVEFDWIEVDRGNGSRSRSSAKETRAGTWWLAAYSKEDLYASEPPPRTLQSPSIDGRVEDADDFRPFVFTASITLGGRLKLWNWRFDHERPRNETEAEIVTANRYFTPIRVERINEQSEKSATDYLWRGHAEPRIEHTAPLPNASTHVTDRSCTFGCVERLRKK